MIDNKESIRDINALTALGGDNKPGGPVPALTRMNGDNSTVTPEIKAQFESAFGVDQNNRTPAQWRNLVKTYGLDRVSGLERMSTSEIVKRCRESFTESVKRSLKARH